MKFVSTLLILASSMVAMVTADMLQINNPTQGTVWTTGVPQVLGWQGNCASMGPAGSNVTVDLVNGPPESVRFVVTLGQIDCSGGNTRAELVIPDHIESGIYAIIVRTLPVDQASYTNMFQINNPAMVAPPVTATTTTTTGGQERPVPTSEKGVNGAPAVGSLMDFNAVRAILAGAAAIAYQLL
ncbi:hypothetical protein BGX33_007732 [Mortierella sp. NVP41]|nr:hypothetical protein BGX33_007732 [Mortierella sp. NVP41]